MKINWKYLKKTPVIIGGIVLFFLVLWILNRSTPTSSTATANGGPDPNAVLAAQTQLAALQIQAAGANQAGQLDYAKAQLEADTSLQALGVQAQIANNQLIAQKDIADANIALQDKALQYNFQQSVNNNQFALDYAEQAYDYSLNTTTINAQLQAHMADDQLAAYRTGAVVQAIGSAKSGDRDQLTAAFIGAMSGQTISYGTPGAKGSVEVGFSNIPAPSSSGGGFNPFGVISPVTNLIG